MTGGSGLRTALPAGGAASLGAAIRATLTTALSIAVGLSAAVALTGCGDDIAFPSTGTVYGDLAFEGGAPAAGITVLVEGTGLSAVSDDEGRFVIGGVVAADESGIGRYYTIRGYGESGGTPVGFLVGHFRVKGQQSYGVGRVVVRPTGAITGSVRLEGETADHSGALVALEGTSLETTSGADGSYLLDRVPAHEGYHVVCGKEGFEEMVLDSVLVEGEFGPIAVAPGETTRVGEADLRRAR